jgi:two-component system chemotaxis sensor kinase CheA
MAEAAREGGEAVVAGQTIRVGVDVLEHLMTLVSELVLTRNQLLQLARSQENAAFAVPLQRLSHITSDLQEGVMKTRMQPIGNAWNKLPRLVRDLAHELGKKIDLVMIGADTELDRQVLELIKDPLTHMVRNSADHGLERPEVRRAAGKPETGHITLNAFHEGGHIIIEIADDGRGLDLARIRAKAQTQGLASEADLAVMSEAQLQRFIFHAGFSTAASVTAVSGRGVGMDVVKTNIERIGGTIDLKSVAGQGSTFTIKIPLTLAIVSALIVEAGGERFAIPQISVVELVRAGGEGSAGGDQPVIERINATPVLRLRDRLLPLVNLRDVLALGSGEETAGELYIVVAQVGSSLLGIIVDRVFDTEEIVVKPVAPILRHITMFSGNTILGDGSVIMILDPNGIARTTGSSGGDQRRPIAEAAEDVTSASSTAMLLFRAGEAAPKAVPLGLVARLEDIPRARIESSSGKMVTQYRGRLMPLVAFDGVGREGETQAVLVFSDGEHSMGLMVDEIVDVVDEVLRIELGTDTPGLLGTAVIAGHATDVINTDYWLRAAQQDWFRGSGQDAQATAPHILIVEDNDFFRQLLVPSLAAAGYRVTAAASAQQALKLRETGTKVDAIISDIMMPDMDGLAFARAIRDGGAWAALPMIALSGRVEPADVEAGREAGFTDYVAKFQREALLVSLRQCLGQTVEQ